jgi:hypothetical protein
MTGPYTPIEDWFGTPLPIIGVVHALPLRGSPRFGGSDQAVLAHVLGDAERLTSGGAAALLLENFGDAPFYPDRVPPIVVAQMTKLACEVRRRFSVPLGINLLRNDAKGALAIAIASGATFIRVNVLGGARLTDQGIIQGEACELLRERAAYGAHEIRIFADVDVKHSAPLAPRPLAEEVRDLVERCGADAVIVSGPRTGQAASADEVRTVKSAAGKAPVLLGSGITTANLGLYADCADGFIVGTSLKEGGDVARPVDVRRVRELVEAVRGCNPKE